MSFSNGPDAGNRREPQRRHESCDPVDIEDIIFPLRVRLAGWARDKQGYVGLEEDIVRFQALESPFVEWRDDLEAAAAAAETVRDAHGISDGMRAALSRFQNEGGHSKRLSPENIRHIMENGVVAFLELQVRNDLSLTLGSVSALSHAPWSTLEESKKGPHSRWPQYDWRTVMPDGAPDDQVEEEARKNLLIVRSSVLPKIEERYFLNDLQGAPLPSRLAGRDLRRLGIAGRGKYEILRMADSFDQTNLTFNIGTLGIPGEKSLNRSNQPSKAHNAWMREMGWRRHVDTILPETEVHKAIYMYWRRYVGSIQTGIDEFTLDQGLLEGKGYPLDEIEDSARENTERMKQMIAMNVHRPW